MHLIRVVGWTIVASAFADGQKYKGSFALMMLAVGFLLWPKLKANGFPRHLALAEKLDITIACQPNVSATA